MKWLLTFPEDKPSVPYYTGWLERGQVSPEISLVTDDFPRVARFDALLLPGGGDVDPARYGVAERHARTGGIDPLQDEREVALIDAFLSADKPVFGICRGQQILNVATGGKLIQHVPDELGQSAPELHSMTGGYDARHGLAWEGDSSMRRALGDAHEVNSSHHQAIRPDAVGRMLRVVARSPAGIIEAVESVDTNRVLSAVQWHPERLPADHPASRNLLQYWVGQV